MLRRLTGKDFSVECSPVLKEHLPEGSGFASVSFWQWQHIDGEEYEALEK